MEQRDSLRSLQKNNLIKLLNDADRLGVDLQKVLTGQNLQCVQLFKEGMNYREIGEVVGLTGSRVQQILTGPTKSVLSTIRYHVTQPKRNKRSVPTREEMVYEIISSSEADLHKAIHLMNVPAIKNLWRAINEIKTK
ncbi:hypothetical protein ACFQZE_23815 [Paenibacillus sp. GCM10027627]|uniref:hypothetical protein n=1 Tax=unclassified Paenibacillus TaxID=185978 RepID=UPI003639A9D7